MNKRIAKKIDNLVIVDSGTGQMKRLLNYDNNRINEAWRIASRKKNAKWFLTHEQKCRRGERWMAEEHAKFLNKIRRRPWLDCARRYRRLNGEAS